MSDGWERTAEEREAARIERERRRAERERAETAPAERFGPEEPFEQDAFPDDPPADAGADDADEEEWEDAPGYEHDHEVPVGIRSVPRAQRLRSTEKAPSPVRRAPQRLRRRKTSRGGRLLALLALVLVGGALWFLYSLFQPFHGKGHGRLTITIPARATVGQIGDLLERDGVVSSSFFFKLRASISGDRGDLRAGTYLMEKDMSYTDALKVLTTPPKQAPVSDLTIIEGKSRKQVDALLRAQHVRGSYLAASRHSKLLDPRRYGAPRSTDTLEGFLFPSTYQLRDPISVNALVADQLQAFRKEFAKVNLGYAKSKHLSAFDVLTIASMVQAEAETNHDRPLIASVIYNRLHDQMPLQIDATTRFATGNYSSPLTDSQLHSPSPYNTRDRKGLPPGPIDSPGLASIEAAAHPSRTKYLYFVVKVCGNGEHVFSSNYNQFLRDSAKYATARAQRGGKSPEKC